MTVTQNTLVGDIAAEVPSSVRVFQRHGLDFCCGGKKPLGIACEERGLSYADIAAQIEAAAQSRDTAPREWTTAALGDIVDHIIATYHEPLREELPRLMAMAERVARVHGQKAPRLLGRMEAILRELSGDLLEHMRKEELVLFPAIRNIEQARPIPMPLAAPIRVMEWDHDRAGELLAELHTLTDGYVLPEWACATVRALYSGLAELEAGMHLHVHLENNVLFPRALALTHGPVA